MPFTLYKSSAGSGKTYVLVKEYLKIALQYPEENFRHILAVTFTNKAAGEMKERIITALKELHRGGAGPLKEELALELPGISIEDRSRLVLKYLLHNYADFAVQTIDSFIHRIVRAFALQLGIHPEFDVELDTELILRKIIDRLIVQVGIDDHITRILVDFALSNIDQDRSWNIEGSLYEIASQITGPEEQYVAQVSRMTERDFDSLIKSLREEVRKYQKYMNGRGRAAIGLIRGAGLSNEDFAFRGEGTVKYLERLQNARRPDDLKCTGRFRSGSWYAKKCDPLVRGRIDELLSGGLGEIHDEIISYEDSNFPRFITAHLLLRTVYPLAVLGEIGRHLEKYKQEQRIILISDFNSKVAEIVERQTIPFIYSIAGDHYHNYLIDEFQDTSRGQWRNIYPLIEEALSSGYSSMAVGDSKQSIYRWRGGDWEILEHETSGIGETYELELRALNRNYRSSESIISFNNDFFEHVAGELAGKYRCELEKIYERESLVQEPSRSSPGYVRVEVLNDGERKKRGKEIALGRMIETIESLRSDGWRYGDIAILVRKNSEGSEIADKLFGLSIPIISPDSLLLCNEPIVNFFIHVLQYLADENEISRACMIHGYGLLGMEDEKRRRVEMGRIQEKILSQMGDAPEPQSGDGILTIIKWRRSLVKLPLYDLLEELIRILSLDSRRFSHMSGYIQGFLDVVLDFTTKSGGDLELFLQWWEEHKQSLALTTTPEKDAIHIMSIHKAKGLEFPVVLIPYANWDLRIKSGSPLWLNLEEPLEYDSRGPFLVPAVRDLEESLFSGAWLVEKSKTAIDNLNLLYVAFTRARERLYVTAFPATGGETVHEIISEAMLTMQGDRSHQGNVYEFGIPERRVSGEESPKVEYQELDRLISNPWKKKIAVRRHSRKLWIETDRARSEKVKWGLLVHNALSRIGELDEGSPALEQALNDMIREGILPRSQLGALEHELNSVLSDERVREWFQPGWEIKAESTIIMAGENIRPDRVLLRGSQAVVIDYKTGKEEAAYGRQLRIYENALKKMGFVDVSSYILYIEDRRIVKV